MLFFDYIIERLNIKIRIIDVRPIFVDELTSLVNYYKRRLYGGL